MKLDLSKVAALSSELVDGIRDIANQSYALGRVSHMDDDRIDWELFPALERMEAELIEKYPEEALRIIRVSFASYLRGMKSGRYSQL